MSKNTAQLSVEIKKLNKKNEELQKQMHAANKSLSALNTGSIDALIVAHKKDVKIYTEHKADEIYRILIERMQEGAVTLNEDGTVLYSNSSFAKMVDMPLQKVIGEKFKMFIDPVSTTDYAAVIKKGMKHYAHAEICIVPKEGKSIPVMMSVNTLSLEHNFVLSIIITNLTFKNRNRAEFKSQLIEKITEVIKGINHYEDDYAKINFSHYLSKQLKYNYTYLANIFSEVKGITIQQFVMIQKIEKAKELLLYGELNLTQIAYKLHYSNVAHLSTQFKNVTGYPPSAFKKMKQKLPHSTQ